VAKIKNAKFGAVPAPRKKPVFGEPLYDDGHPLAWRFSGVDRGGPFAWNIEPHEKFHEILHKLFEFENKNWAEITAGGSHPIPVDRLCPEAQKRLVDIEKDDFDELLSLRLTGANRVWCVKSGHIVRPLWWDAEHQVYPVAKDPADRKKKKRR
jgi:hypothetical protein